VNKGGAHIFPTTVGNVSVGVEGGLLGGGAEKKKQPSRIGKDGKLYGCKTGEGGDIKESFLNWSDLGQNKGRKGGQGSNQRGEEHAVRTDQRNRRGEKVPENKTQSKKNPRRREPRGT